jgi:adenylate cyclase
LDIQSTARQLAVDVQRRDGATLRLSQYAVDLAGGDATKGGKIATSSPLALAMSFTGLARWCLGITGWRDDFEQAVQMVKTAEAVTRGGVLSYTRTLSILHGVRRPDDAILHEMTENLSSAEQAGEDVAFGLAKSNVAFALLHRDGGLRAYALELLGQIRDIAMRRRYSRTAIPMIDAFVAQDLALKGDLDGAIELSRGVVDEEIDGGGVIFIPMATNVLVDAVLQRGTDADIQEAMP